MNFIDSNIIAYAFYENKNRDRCREFIRKGGMTDSLALIEAFNIIEHQITRRIAVDSIKSLLKANFEIINIDENIVFEALKRSEKYKKLKFLDLVHYIIALIHNCEEFISYDKDFDGLEIKRIEP
ncbi:PIN domain-containing protein [Candidatus Woesearchaeota archaeon]|nr:PIN domain-containing protein [Candidatus Woesearchaeota archaeon]